MWLSFLKKANTYKKYISSLDDIQKYMKYFEREIKINQITSQIASDIDELIRFWNLSDDELNIPMEEKKPIKIYINSLGGDLDAAITIMNAINMSKTPIYTFNIGSVQKESFFIYIAGHKRFCYENAYFVYSDSVFNYRFNNTEDKTQFYNQYKLFKKEKDNIKQSLFDKINITKSQYNKHCKNDWWISSSDAFQLHIVNEISKKHFYYIER